MIRKFDQGGGEEHFLSFHNLILLTNIIFKPSTSFLVYCTMVVSRIIDPSADCHSNVTVESVLRLRPLSKREMEDTVILEQTQSILRNGPATVVLNPSPASLASPVAGGMRGRAESDATANSTPTEYHFHHVLPDTTSQDKIYYTLGLPIATTAMSALKNGGSRSSAEPKSQLLVCMGVAGSGKTYTCLGGSNISKRRASQDGLVPRLVDSMFSQSKHHATNGTSGFAVNISMAQVTHSRGDPHACVLHDLLGSGSSDRPKEKKPKRNNLGVRSMAAKFERAIASPIRARSPMRSVSADVVELDSEHIEMAVESCADVTQAREVLQKGLVNGTKVANGKTHHLLITLQPVSGSKVGDKIAILDMAGLEKGGRKSISRVKDSVANKNQEASAAVLHCLRTMMHNTNVRSGKSNTLDIIDDEISEISAVSQKKDPIRRQLKSVPFRQHKVTMLLQSLFTETAATKVTLLLAAYPGHTDYTEKRILLQDMELLCGGVLINKNGNASTGLTIPESQSYENSFGDSQSPASRGSFRETDVYSDAGSIPSFKKSRDHIRNSAASSGSLALSASLDEYDQNISQPSACAPFHSRDSRGSSSGHRVPATAPMIDIPEPMAPPQRTTSHPVPHKNPKYVSDFPGVQLPTKKELSDPIMERTRVTTISSSSNVGGRGVAMPPSEGARSFKRDQLKQNPHLEDSEPPARSFVPSAQTKRLPLSRSSLENDRRSEQYSAGEGRRPVEQEDKKDFTQAFQAISTPRQKVETQANDGLHGGKWRPNRNIDRTSRESDDSVKKVKELEKRMKDLQRAKEEYERRCKDLERENDNLKHTVRDAVTQAQSKWTKFDEEQFMKAREARLEDQAIVKKSFKSHLERINYHYEIKNQWCMTNKPHFEVVIPSHFQRAEELNIRDKTYEEREAEVLNNSENYAPPQSDQVETVSPVKIPAQKNVSSTSAAKQPSTFQALKRLTFGY